MPSNITKNCLLTCKHKVGIKTTVTVIRVLYHLHVVKFKKL